MNKQEAFIRRHAAEKLVGKKANIAEKERLIDDCIQEWKHNGNVETAISKMLRQVK